MKWRLLYHWKQVPGSVTIYTVLLLLFSPLLLTAQRQHVYTNGMWGGYFGNFALNKRLAIGAEIEVHGKEWAQRWADQGYNMGLVENLSARWRTAGGVSWYRNAQYQNTLFFKNEYRLYQEANYTLQKNWVWGQRLRLEERWIQQLRNGRKIDSFGYNTRLRYRSELQKPLWNGVVTPVLGNEVMVVPAAWNSSRFWDQNRTWIGLHVRVAKTTTLQFHYLKVFLWRPNNTLEEQNIFRLNIAQKLNLAKS